MCRLPLNRIMEFPLYLCQHLYEKGETTSKQPFPFNDESVANPRLVEICRDEKNAN